MELERDSSAPDLTPIVELLRSRDRFLLTGHVRPDGDCLGAECALFHVLSALGKKVAIVNPDPLSERYAFLQEMAPYRHWRADQPRGGTERFDVACVLDVATLDRTGPIAAQIREDRVTTCVFDHHQPVAGPGFHVSYIDSKASATGVLIYRVAKALQIALPKAALEGVFISLTTDTGWFKYSNTDREAFHVAGELVAGGVDPSEVYNKLFQRFSPQYPPGIGIALRGMRYAAGGKIAICTIRPSELDAAGAELHETDDVLDILRSVGAVDVVLLFRELASGRVKISARSKGAVDVHALLQKFGGGGHRRAAGADIAGALEAVTQRVVAAAVATVEGRPAS